MQFTTNRDDFAKALAAAGGAIASRATLPILSHVLLGTDEEGCFVQATDMDIEIVRPFAAKVVEGGAVAAPARILSDIVKRMPAGASIAVSTVNNRLKVVCGKSRFELNYLPAEDYPELEIKTGQVWTFEIEAEAVRELLGGVRHAIADDEARYYLNGVYLHAVGEEACHLIAAATNGHMLMQATAAAPPLCQGMPGVILPKKTVGEILKLLPSGDDLVTMKVCDRLVVLELAGGVTLASKLIDGTYPDYARVIPLSNPHRAVVAADVLASAIARVATLCEKGDTGVVVFFKPGGPITVSIDRAGVGSGQDKVPATVDGARAAIGFNHRYFATMLGALAGGTIELRYGTAADAVLMRLEGEETVTGVLMPMRANVDAKQLDEAA